LFNLEDPSLFVVFAAVIGSIFGSFSNVIISRLVQGQSIVVPRSHCPNCKKTLKWHHLVPIFSWIFLKGKCGFCATKISVRYPVVEILMAYLFGLCVYHYGLTVTSLEYLIFIFGLVTASFIDIDHYLLPDKITLLGIVLGLFGSIVNPERQFIDSLLGVIFGGGALWLVAYLYQSLRNQEGLGGGDIKLIAWIGALLGWKSIAFVVMTGSLVGTVFGLALSLGSKQGLKTAIPFGPYLALGALLYIFGGSSLNTLYLSLFFPQP
jgi:leader peptidase (prepilin peptidase)/N-methyltransferase